MAKHSFGGALARLRAEQGFESAHAFYRSRSGRRSLGLSFANYLALEKGRSLPKPFRVKALLSALGVKPEDARARALVRSYLVSLLGSDDLLAGLGGDGAGSGKPASWRLAEDAARQALVQRTAQLTQEQWVAIASDRLVHDCYMLLVNTPGWQTVKELARAVGTDAARAGRALKVLAGAGLAETAAGKARSPLSGKHVEAPPMVPAFAGINARLHRYWKDWAEKKGRLVRMNQLVVRMDKPELERFVAHLDDVVDMASVYGDVEKTAGTAVYLVQGRVLRLFD